MSEIRGGVEYFEVRLPDGRVEHDSQCARCGSSTYWVDCWNCGGDGYTDHECGEDCCACAFPEDNVPCDMCRTAGGWDRCCSPTDYCQAHPMPGREHIPASHWSDDDD